CVKAAARIRRDRQIPVAVLGYAVARHRQIAPRQKLAHASQNAVRVRDAEQMEIFAERRRIDIGRDSRISEEALHFRCEEQVLAIRKVIQRFDAKAVTSEKHLLLALVPDREREHAVDRLEEALPLLKVQVKQDFGVGTRAKAVAARAQRARQLAVIVALAVVSDPNRAILARHRLMARRGQFDAREPTMDPPDAAAQHQPAIVRPAMGDQLGHAAEQARIGDSAATELKYARYAAHCRFLGRFLGRLLEGCWLTRARLQSPCATASRRDAGMCAPP